VVVGAKGSPLQLILSGVFHLDTPTGNVPLAAIDSLAAHPQVAKLIPISLGDNFRGFRIVGTSPAYVQHYGAALAQGSLWQAPMQAVLGHEVARASGLKPGDSFAGSHGLGTGGASHGSAPYAVVGVLAPSGSVLDRLVLTATESVWQVHEDQNLSSTDSAEDRAALMAEREITLALIQYKTPLAAVTFPRFINTTTEMQAAAPAVEVARLLSLVGVGADVLKALSGVLLLTAGLSVFVAMWTSVRERRADLALLRMLGAPPQRVAGLLLCEALWLAVLAAVLGLLLGQIAAAALGGLLQLEKSFIMALSWPPGLWLVPVLALAVALGSALLPIREAYRISVLELLQSRSS
jgi:putative ABC transport system permease protein